MWVPAWLSVAFLTFLATFGVKAVAQPTLHQLRVDLQVLTHSLRWKGSTHTTYAPVQEAAIQAHSTLVSINGHDRSLIPQAVNFRQTLERLIAEARYLVNLSAAKNYTQSILDSTMFLTGSIDEWHYTIAIMIKGLEKPSCYRASRFSNSTTQHISQATAPGTEFRDHDVAPTMVVIPTGSFTAGSSPAEQELWNVPVARRSFELPHREVQIATPLAFSRTEVTVAQFDAFVHQSCYQTRGGSRWWNPINSSAMVFNHNLSYRNPGFPQTPDHPVVAITRQDAEAYAHWLSTITGATYRLPTEDEWEWAARGGSHDTFFWGNNLKQAGLFANTYDINAQQANHFNWPATTVMDGFAYTAPVASFEPNAFGLYDVTGNAREFMADSWVPNLSTAANDGSIHIGPAPFPVVRGGAWNYQPQNLRINYRSAYFSSEVATNMFGIRLVREL